MTHEELLDIFTPSDVNEDGQYSMPLPHPMFNALRAVVELHKPDIENKYCDYDSPEWEIVTYPCPTIQAIEKEFA